MTILFTNLGPEHPFSTHTARSDPKATQSLLLNSPFSHSQQIYESALIEFTKYRKQKARPSVHGKPTAERTKKKPKPNILFISIPSKYLLATHTCICPIVHTSNPPPPPPHSPHLPTSYYLTLPLSCFSFSILFTGCKQIAGHHTIRYR